MNININNFDGPLDLLLHLIKVNEMDIMDIKIEEITKQYIDYINSMEALNIEVASEYLVMASELIEIKSRYLLPKEKIEEDSEEEIDPREELTRRLLEYDAYKRLSSLLEERNEERGFIYTKLPESSSNYIEETNYNGEGNIDDLVEAFKLYLNRKKKNKPLKRKVTVNEISVSSRCIEIRNVLKKRKKISFFSLFEREEKEYIVATFLAILEMAKNREININQKNNFSDITLESV